MYNTEDREVYFGYVKDPKEQRRIVTIAYYIVHCKYSTELIYSVSINKVKAKTALIQHGFTPEIDEYNQSRGNEIAVGRLFSDKFNKHLRCMEGREDHLCCIVFDLLNNSPLTERNSWSMQGEFMTAKGVFKRFIKHCNSIEKQTEGKFTTKISR